MLARHADGAFLLAVADGAGGLGGGAEAAEQVIDSLDALGGGSVIRSSAQLVQALEATDRAVARSRTAGETTAVVAVACEGNVLGASVGDSEAWMLQNGQVTTLTSGQARKPLLGSGRCVPVPFGPLPLRGRLLLGTDGLFKYADHAQLVDAVARLPLPRLADVLGS